MINAASMLENFSSLWIFSITVFFFLLLTYFAFFEFYGAYLTRDSITCSSRMSVGNHVF
jgi:hypothetical protein